MTDPKTTYYVPDGTLASIMSEESANKYQQWLWQQIENIQRDEEKNLRNQWTHEDGQRAASLGFMLTMPPQIAHRDPPPPLEIFSMVRGKSARQVYNRILAMAQHGDSLCKKAVGIMTKERFKFPDHKFNHQRGDDE